MTCNRRAFLHSAALGTAAMMLGFKTPLRAEEKSQDQIWGYMIQLGHNMWGDTPRSQTPPSDEVLLDVPLWNEITEQMSAIGMNLLLIDIGEALQYQSHPEIAIKGAWTVDRLREEIARLRKMGIEPIPKLNFSTSHDFWLGEYARMVSTSQYYEVCADLIKEVCEIFDHPRFFHIGYDEETARNQKTYDYVVVRQGELWWHDFLFFVNEVEKQGVRSWIWSDYYWEHPDEFLNKMPKSVLQSSWYYGKKFGPNDKAAQTHKELGEAGFDLIPAGSNCEYEKNFRLTVDFCKENVPEEHLLGFLMTPWVNTVPSNREALLDAVDKVKEMMD